MPLFSVQYTYRDDKATAQGRQDHGPGHLAFVRMLEAQGVLLLAGRWAPSEREGGQFLLRGDSAVAIRDLVGADPYIRAGFVEELRVHEWNVTLGSLASQVAETDTAG